MSAGTRYLGAMLSVIFGLAAHPARGAPLTPGNVLVIRGDLGPDTVLEFTPSGVLVQTLVVPNPAGPGPRSDTIRDAAVTADGRLAIFDGTFNPFLNLLDPATGTSQSFTLSGWSTTGTFLGGGIAIFGDSAFATDMRTFGSPDQVLNGLIRFNTVIGAGQRFADGTDFVDVAVGFDGLVYGLPSGVFPGRRAVFVYDPNTLQELRRVVLSGTGPAGVFAVAVNGDGEIFAGSGNISGVSNSIITRHAPDGQLLATLILPGTGIGGLDLDGSGNLVAISANGLVFLTTEDLTSFATLTSVGPGFDRNVAFVPRSAIVPEPASLLLAACGAGMVLLRSLSAGRMGDRR